MANFERFLKWFDHNSAAMRLSSDPQSAQFTDIFDEVEGCCAKNTMALVNFLVTECMGDDEIYCEIGTYYGRTLIAALRGNDALAESIDPFIHDDSAAGIYRNIEKHNLEDRVNVHHQRWEDFVGDGNKLENVGVFMNDGDHGTGSTYDSLEAFFPFLSERSVIVIDDTHMVPVQKDIDKWLEKHADNIEFYRHAPFFMGQAIIGCKK